MTAQPTPARWIAEPKADDWIRRAAGQLGVEVSLFVNAENLLDVRQTKYDPLLLPRRAASGQWTVDAWAPLKGFILNGGIGYASADTDLLYSFGFASPPTLRTTGSEISALFLGWPQERAMAELQ